MRFIYTRWIEKYIKKISEMKLLNRVKRYPIPFRWPISSDPDLSLLTLTFLHFSGLLFRFTRLYFLYLSHFLTQITRQHDSYLLHGYSSTSYDSGHDTTVPGDEATLAFGEELQTLTAEGGSIQTEIIIGISGTSLRQVRLGKIPTSQFTTLDIIELTH